MNIHVRESGDKYERRVRKRHVATDEISMKRLEKKWTHLWEGERSCEYNDAMKQEAEMFIPRRLLGGQMRRY